MTSLSHRIRKWPHDDLNQRPGLQSCASWEDCPAIQCWAWRSKSAPSMSSSGTWGGVGAGASFPRPSLSWTEEAEQEPRSEHLWSSPCAQGNLSFRLILRAGQAWTPGCHGNRFWSLHRLSYPLWSPCGCLAWQGEGPRHLSWWAGSGLGAQLVAADPGWDLEHRASVWPSATHCLGLSLTPGLLWSLMHL